MASKSAIVVTAVALRGRIPQDAPLRERLRFAMCEVRRDGNGCTFMCSSDDERFRGAISAVLLDASEEEREQINNALHNLKCLSALIEGVPVDVSQMKLDNEPTLGLLGMWHECEPK